MFVFVAFSIGVILGTLVNPFSTILSRLTEDKDKKIEKIQLDEWIEFTTKEDIKHIDYMFNKNSNTFTNKINEIIDYINKEDNK